MALALYSGGWSDYKEWRDQERERLFGDLETAKKEKLSAAKEHREKMDKQAKDKVEEKRSAKRWAPSHSSGKKKKCSREFGWKD